ncbi:MAG: immune inhibitor A [Chloroflexi bacterium]|nr:immune inhibitor A [Chloroflexota bacterium]
MEGRTFNNGTLGRCVVASTLLTALLLLAALAACRSQPPQPAPGAAPSPTAVPAPNPDRETPVPAEAPALALKPSLSPTAPAAGQPPTLVAPAHFAPPPPSDLIALARRFRPGQDARLAVAPVLGPADVGRVEDFWVVDLARQRIEKVRATLRLVTPHALWYTAAGVNADSAQLEELAAQFEERVYPSVSQATLGRVPERSTEGFGAPAAMLITPLSGAAGYFSSGDYYTPGVFPYSNGRPMLYLDARVVRAGPGAFRSLTGHEYQHLLHHLADPTEHTWVNEGISEVTAGLVARGRAVTPPGFRDEVSLTNWPRFGSGVGRHYNAAHLFFIYFTQRYGIDALAPLVARPEDGAAGIKAYLREAGHDVTFAQLFMDWSTANLLGERAPMPYGYADDSPLSLLSPPRALSPDQRLSGSVAPFATGYVRLDVPASGGLLRFSGDPTAAILDTSPYSGQACWWSNRGDSSHSRLTHEFDLSQVSSAALTFRMWHNLEELWDYLYVTASADGGETWRVLPGTHTVTDDPIGATYGPGITGQSQGWVVERVDLTPFTGASVLVSFEQVLDAAISLDGACIDDIAVPEIGFFDDAETGGDWSADGFVRTGNVLPQRFGVRLVIDRGEGNVTVTDVPLDAMNAGSLPIPALAPGESATVLVASLTPHTRLPADYELRLVTQPS